MKRALTVLLFEDGWQRGSLAATRSLAAAGHEVVIASPQRGHSARSRSSRRWVRTPLLTDPAFGEQAPEVVRREGADVVFAGDDEHLLSLSPLRSKLGGVLFPYPEHDVVLRALDKLQLYATAASSGLTVPEYRTDPPREGGDAWIAKHTLYLPGRSHDYHRGATDPALVEGRLFQRVVEGDLLAVVTLTAPDGRPLYAAAQQAEAVSPGPFGVTARGRTVALDPELRARVLQLLAELGWWGLAELQFVVPRDGTPHLIDLNGRFYGSLALTAAAGVDLPTAWLDAACGEEVRLGQPRIGVRYQWLLGDLQRVWRSPDRSASDWWQALRYAPGAAHSVWSLRDPVPASRQALELVTRRGLGMVGR